MAHCDLGRRVERADEAGLSYVAEGDPYKMIVYSYPE
jgi:hypothetical protein